MPKPTIITTSREPSRRTRSFIKDLACLAPWLVRLTRGKLTFQELVEHALGEGAATLAIVCERKANPSLIRIYDLTQPLQDGLPIHAYTIFLKGITLSREKGRRTSDLKVREAVVDAEPPRTSEERDVILSLLKLFGARPAIEEREEEGVLRIIVRYMARGAVIEFQDTSTGRLVGPVIRIDGVKKIGRPAGPG